MLFKEKIVSNFRDMTSLGSYVVIIPLIVFIYFIGLKNLALQFFVGFIVTYIIAFIIRIFYFKDRPEKEKYNSFLSRIDSSSFPSVHAARSIMFAILLSVYYKSLLLTLFLILIALLVSYSRIFLKKHYWIDVVVGFIMGIVLALLIVSYL
ncbi:MAG TPA: phosphatase PAP2 family protein [Candidatus Nanoarchaeia archaeon]|nr:phosphatase PAP2 family protein [Candidatus Nanoarchaeia archaeon]